jgi:stage II sporulation protein AA (anti-sigma F factor antagonist)
MKGLVQMGVELISRGKVLCAKLSGDIDHHGAKELRRDIDIAIEENCPSELILDFSAVTFMDSSGIGLVMGRYKLMNERGGTVTVAKTPAYIGKVMRVSGVGKLARIVNDYTLPREDEQEVMKIETTNQ